MNHCTMCACETTVSNPGERVCLKCRSEKVRSDIDVKYLKAKLDALTLHVDAVIASVPEIGLSQAEDLSKRCDYMDASCEIEGNEVNTADAGQFFLEGYNHARELWRKGKLAAEQRAFEKGEI